MEKAKDGFDLQADVLVRMLGITTPGLILQARDLLRKAIESNPESAINDSAFFGRLKKLLFKPVPRKPKIIDRKSSSSVVRPEPTDPVTPAPARRVSSTVEDDWYNPFKNGKYRFTDEDQDFQEYHDASTAAAPYQEDIIVPSPHGTYNSRGLRYDEDGDIVRDERVYMCESAIYQYSNGTPHITDTYDLYALVQSVDLPKVPEAIHQLLSSGIYVPTQDLQTAIKLPEHTNTQTTSINVPVQRTDGLIADQGSVPPSPSTFAAVSQKRNLIAHYIRTISLPPPIDEEYLTSKQIRKFRFERGKQEKARLRQLKIFLAALKA